MIKYIKLFFVVTISIIFIGCANAKKYKEKHYQTLFCNDLDGVMEYSLSDRTRVDCLTDEYAIEIDFAKKWAESVGQSLYYAEMTEKKPAIALIVDDTKKDKKRMNRLKVLATKYKIKVFKITKE